MEANSIPINTTSAPVVGSKDPVFMDTFIASGHLLCALFGIPLNMTIILFIVTLRRLRRQPRNIVWIGIGVSTIFVLFTNLLEPIVFYSNTESTELCHIHFFLVGFPGASILMNNCLSLADRYFSIFHSVWYRRCVTVRLVLGIQLAAFITLFFLMKSHYIFGLIQVKCNVVHPLDRTIYIGFFAFFLILCLSGQITVFLMIKKHLVATTNVGSTNGCNDTTTNASAESTPRDIQQNSHHSTDNHLFIIPPEEAVRSLGFQTESKSIMKNNSHFVRIRDQMVSRLELEATRNVILSVGIMLLFTSPWIITSVLAEICNTGYFISWAKDEGEAREPFVEQCSPYFWATSYTRLILLIGHSIYQSIFSVIRSKDFSAVLGRALGRRFNRYCVRKSNAPAPVAENEENLQA